MKNRAIPRLRFKGFNNRWLTNTLNHITTHVDYRGKTPHKVNKGIQLITAKNIKKGYINYKINKEYISSRDYSKVMHRGIPHKGDVLFTTEAPVGNTAQINNVHIALAQRVIKFTGKYNILNNTFLANLFLSQGFRHILHAYSTGGTVKGIKGRVLVKINIHYPKNICEQQLIGKFFAKLDKLIRLQQKKVSLLKKLKQGYLQELFRNRNENFISLDKLCDIKTGNKNANENIPNGKYPFFDRSTEVKHLNTYDYNEEAIIYAGEGEQFLPRYFNGKYSLHQRAYSLYNFKKDLINVIYLYEFLLTQSHRFIRYAVGSTVKSLRMDCFKHIYIPILPLKKQNIVGKFLSQISMLIKLHLLKITDLRKLKKAYLQKMFC